MRHPIAFWLGGVVAGYFVAAFLGALIPGKVALAPDPGTPVEIVLISGPIHYDLLLPLDAGTKSRLGWLRRTGVSIDHAGAEWLVVGWGAREFYTITGGYTDVRPRAVWRALTGDSAVLRVSLAGALPPDTEARRLSIDPTQYAALIRTIEDSLPYGRNTPALDIKGFSEFDRFFPAKGRFHAFNTCNVWIGKVLRQAGIRFGRWTPTPYAVSLSHAVHH